MKTIRCIKDYVGIEGYVVFNEGDICYLNEGKVNWFIEKDYSSVIDVIPKTDVMTFNEHFIFIL